MKRNKKRHYKDYITARIAQLRDDALKASDPTVVWASTIGLYQQVLSCFLKANWL